MNEQDQQVRRIVVGVDGSDSSKEALRWAIRQAALVHGEVDAVIACMRPANYYHWLPEVESGVLEDRARSTLQGAVRELAETGPGVPIHTSVVWGDPVWVLVEAARDAELLVVGSRGYGTFAGALVGSVSNRCVHHAQCPVAVIRSRKSV